MSHVVKLTLATVFVVCLQVSGLAQLSVPPTPLNLSEDLPTVHTPAFTNLADPRCDRDGTIYTRQQSADGARQVTSVSLDGSVEHIQLAAVPGFGDTHTFATATSDGGAVQEVVRAQNTSDPSHSPSIYYLQFAADGSFRSRQEFEQEFIPAILLPLPSGNFFAVGVVMKKSPEEEEVEELPVAGIFDSDTRLISKLQSAAKKKGRLPLLLIPTATLTRQCSKADM